MRHVAYDHVPVKVYDLWVFAVLYGGIPAASGAWPAGRKKAGGQTGARKNRTFKAGSIMISSYRRKQGVDTAYTAGNTLYGRTYL